MICTEFRRVLAGGFFFLTCMALGAPERTSNGDIGGNFDRRSVVQIPVKSEKLFRYYRSEDGLKLDSDIQNQEETENREDSNEKSRDQGEMLNPMTDFKRPTTVREKVVPKRKKIVCYYDRTVSLSGLVELNVHDLNTTMSLCTDLVYGFAMVDWEKGTINMEHSGMDLLLEREHIQTLQALRSFFPGLKILLGIGAPPSADSDTKRYTHFRDILKTENSRLRFINSLLPVLQKHSFDGIDLLWRFELKSRDEDCGCFCRMWRGISDIFSSPEELKTDIIEMRNQFSDLLQQIKTILYNYTMAVSVLASTDSVFYDHEVINKLADQIHLLTFDYSKPWNEKLVAEDSSPIRKVDGTVLEWLWHNVDRDKLIVGIPTFARTWKLSKVSVFNTSPPVIAAGPGKEGSYTSQKGLLAYYEVCSKSSKVAYDALTFTEAIEPDKYANSYAYRLPSKFASGLWASFEDPHSVTMKANYVKDNNLGGVIIHGLVYDDFRGFCGEKFSLLKHIANKLNEHKK